jgi:nicotinamide-nucleotide amidase
VRHLTHRHLPVKDFDLPSAFSSANRAFGIRFIIPLLWLLSFAATVAGTSGLPFAPRPPLDYMLVVTGEELLRGAFPDAHTAFITRTLHLLGGHCVGSMIVDDKAEDIVHAVRLGSQKAKLVIVTGGLGPTVNDVTRGAVAEVTGIDLAEHPGALAELERRFQQSRDQLRPNLRRQTLVPVRGTYLKNPEGTAVGLVFEPEGAVIVALPGPPRELRPMVTNELVPYLREKFGLRAPGSSLTLRFVGLGQSLIDQTIRDHVPIPQDAVVGSMFEGSRVDFVFALPGDSAADRARLRRIETDLRRQLGDSIYASDGTTLEGEVVKALRARAGSLVLVEIGSGGHLAASLNGAPGIEQLLKTAFVAPTEGRMIGTLDIGEKDWISWKPGAERTRALARAAQKRTRSQFVVAIGERGSDDAGKGSVWMAFGSSPDELEAEQVEVQGSGETAHANLVTQVLDRLRRRLK